MTVDCVTCEDSFDTESAMKIHHSLAHGESLAKKDTTCEECGASFSYYPSSKEGKYCGECVENNEHRELIEEKECPNCEKLFCNRQKYCSRSCYIEGDKSDLTDCQNCGKQTTDFPEDNPLCKVCKQKYDRKERKIKLIELHGGSCNECGHSDPVSLEFHHRESEEKKFQLSGNNILRDWESVKKEAEKCDLLCCNCHLENHCTGHEFCEHSSGRFST